MEGKKCEGTPLEVFSGKEAKLNRAILQTLKQKGALISYDVWRFVTAIKEFSHTERKTVYSRVETLAKEGYLDQKGTRATQPGWPSELYEISLSGEAALEVDKKSINQFLRTATKEKLKKFLESYSSNDH